MKKIFINSHDAVKFIENDCLRIASKFKRKPKRSTFNSIKHSISFPVILHMEFANFRKEYLLKNRLIIKYIDNLDLCVNTVNFYHERCCGITGDHGFIMVTGHSKINPAP